MAREHKLPNDLVCEFAETFYGISEDASGLRKGSASASRVSEGLDNLAQDIKGSDLPG